MRSTWGRDRHVVALHSEAPIANEAIACRIRLVLVYFLFLFLLFFLISFFFRSPPLSIQWLFYPFARSL